jgi:hypothetical protein
VVVQTIGAVAGFLVPYLRFKIFTRMGWEKSAKSDFQPPTSFIKVSSGNKYFSFQNLHEHCYTTGWVMCVVIFVARSLK